MEFHGRNVNLMNRFGKFSRIKKGVPLCLREKRPLFLLVLARQPSAASSDTSLSAKPSASQETRSYRTPRYDPLKPR